MRTWCSRLCRSPAGFTLVEMLVAVAIIALLAALAVPRLWDAIGQARDTQGTADLRTIAAALDRYFSDHLIYPNGADADAVVAALRSAYLRGSTTYRNGHRKGYLYLTSTSGLGFVLIDVRKDTHDDQPGTPGQQIIVRCTDGSTNEDRVFTVVTGETAGLTLPTVAPGDYWTVPDTHIDDCRLLTTGLSVGLLRH